MGRTVLRATLMLLLTLVLVHISKGGTNAVEPIELTKQLEGIQTSSMENGKHRVARDDGRKGNNRDNKKANKGRKKSGQAKRNTRKNTKKIGQNRKNRMKHKKKQKKNKKQLRKMKQNLSKNKKKSRTKKHRQKKGKKSSSQNRKKSGQKKKPRQNKKESRKSSRKSIQQKSKKNELSKWAPKQECDEIALCQKIKDYIKISNQLRKVRRIVKSCDTMDKKAKKSGAEFEATVTALETAIGATSGRRIYRSRWRRADESSDDVTTIKDKLKNCSVTAKAKCQKSSVAPCQEEENLAKCETELLDWLNKFGPAKGSCLQASSDCCACITALPDVSKDCLTFDKKSETAVASKKKCTSGDEQGSFGFCKKLQVEAAEKGPKHAKDNCKNSGPGSITTKSPPGKNGSPGGDTQLPQCQVLNSACSITECITGICCQFPTARMGQKEMRCHPHHHCPPTNASSLGRQERWVKIINDGFVRSIAITGDDIYAVGLFYKVWKHSRDGTGGWEKVIDKGAVTDIAINYNNNVLYGIGILFNRIFTNSIIAPGNWILSNIKNDRSIVSITIDTNIMYGAGLGGGVWKYSLDGGRTDWQVVTSPTIGQVTSIAIHNIVSGTIYGVGLFNQIWTSPLSGGGPWTAKINNGAVTSIAIKDNNDGFIYGVGLFGKIWRHVI